MEEFANTLRALRGDAQRWADEASNGNLARYRMNIAMEHLPGEIQKILESVQAESIISHRMGEQMEDVDATLASRVICNRLEAIEPRYSSRRGVA